MDKKYYHRNMDVEGLSPPSIWDKMFLVRIGLWWTALTALAVMTRYSYPDIDLVYLFIMLIVGPSMLRENKRLYLICLFTFATAVLAVNTFALGASARDIWFELVSMGAIAFIQSQETSKESLLVHLYFSVAMVAIHLATMGILPAHPIGAVANILLIILFVKIRNSMRKEIMDGKRFSDSWR